MTKLRVHGALGVLLVTASLLRVNHALAWEPFRSSNGHVDDGNLALKKNDAKGALASYDKAARELPSAAGVHLDRGLALLAQGELAKAREAFLVATEPPAPDDVRAAAYYNMGLAFYREGDAAAKKDQHEPAQAAFREAVDALKRSLRAAPGNRDAAWNLELASRRIQEEQKKQEEKQKQDQEKKDQQKKDEQQNQDQQQKNDQDQNKDQKQDSQKKDEPQDSKDDQNKAPNPQDQNGQKPQDQPQQKPDAQNGQGREPQKDQAQPNPDAQDPSQGTPLPDHVRKALDALQESEDNFERQRAKARARRENRRVLKDW